MRSTTTASFRQLLHRLPAKIQQQAQKQYALWRHDPFHPSLHFKKVGDLWSVRVGAHYRALGTSVEDGVYWFWIGTHADYDKVVA